MRTSTEMIIVPRPGLSLNFLKDFLLINYKLTLKVKLGWSKYKHKNTVLVSKKTVHWESNLPDRGTKTCPGLVPRSGHLFVTPGHVFVPRLGHLFEPQSGHLFVTPGHVFVPRSRHLFVPLSGHLYVTPGHVFVPRQGTFLCHEWGTFM